MMSAAHGARPVDASDRLPRDMPLGSWARVRRGCGNELFHWLVLFCARSALIQQICAVKRKDIRKFLDGIYVSYKGNVIEE